MGLISASGTVNGVAQGTVQVNGDFANFCLHNASRTSPKKSPLGSLPAGSGQSDVGRPVAEALNKAAVAASDSLPG